jgi:hypothetical protein
MRKTVKCKRGGASSSRPAFAAADLKFSQLALSAPIFYYQLFLCSSAVLPSTCLPMNVRNSSRISMPDTIGNENGHPNKRRCPPGIILLSLFLKGTTSPTLSNTLSTGNPYQIRKRQRGQLGQPISGMTITKKNYFSRRMELC